MNSLVLAVFCFAGYIIAYRVYGRFLAGKIFKLNDATESASVKLNDGKDFVPTKKGILFGHHFI